MNKYPKPIGPYSVYRLFENIGFCSGMLPIDPKTNNLVEEDIKIQTKCCLNNIEGLLKELGLGLNNVLKVTIYLKDLAHFNDMNEVYSQYFSNPFPARTCIQVCALPKNSLIEIEVIFEKEN